jgi:hypothetical protein
MVEMAGNLRRELLASRVKFIDSIARHFSLATRQACVHVLATLKQLLVAFLFGCILLAMKL